MPHLSNYPPGVSGNEPEITGDWPDEAEAVAEDEQAYQELYRTERYEPKHRATPNEKRRNA